MLFWTLFLFASFITLHLVPAMYIYGHCTRSAHSLYSWVKFMSDAPDIREELQELPFFRRYPQLYMLWLSLKLTKLFSGVNPETYLQPKTVKA
ncbi:MAG: hypothetical protein JWO15_3553 [Sphingomonadales bacterium]|nr:hypothetical protein [Sphingomonadales bacterium]